MIAIGRNIKSKWMCPDDDVTIDGIGCMGLKSFYWHHHTASYSTVFLMKARLNYSHDFGSDGNISLGFEEPSTVN